MEPLAIVTGANKGIGLAITRGLLLKGFRTVMVCRSEERAAQARDALLAGDGIDPADVIIEQADLSDLDQTAQLAARLADRPMRVFVHNAGLWPQRREMAHGLERSFVVNHLAPFILNRVLERRFEADATRVVQVSAGLAALGKVQPDHTARGLGFSRLRSYADTKLCNLICSLRWAERWRHATLNSVHPGVVRTDLGDESGVLGWLARQVKRSWITPAAGARGPLRLATAEDLAGSTGGYFHELVAAEPPKAACDPQLSDQLWDEAMRLTGEHAAGVSREPQARAG